MISLLGAITGVVLGLTGAGGGILAVPMLVFGAGLSLTQAGPVALLAVAIAASLGALLGLRQGIVRYRAALLIAVSGMLLTPIGLLAAHRLGNRWLGLVFGLIMLFVAFRAFRHRIPPSDFPFGAWRCLVDQDSGRLIWTPRSAFILILWGAIAGLLSGLLGVGGGFVLVPALQRFTNLTLQSIIATSLAVIALVSTATVLISSASGALPWAIAIPFSAGVAGGMVLGRLLAHYLAGRPLQLLFALVLSVVAAGMIAKALVSI